MKTAAVCCALIALAAMPAARAQAVAAEAAARCEADVQSTLDRLHGKALRSVRFDAAGRALVRGDGDDASLRGTGRYTLATGGAMFQYSCALNLRTGETSGAVLRDAGTAAAQARREQAWEPDLARVTPADCESATAALLKDRNPRIARIAFDPETRRLEPADEDRIGLQGRGALQRAPGMLAAQFSYRCEFDGRNGRVVAVQASD